MPTYEYRCSDCQREFEEFVQSSASRKTPACPSCGSQAVSRQLSLFAARQGQASSGGGNAPMGGCGRCGDPEGPCGL